VQLEKPLDQVEELGRADGPLELLRLFARPVPGLLEMLSERDAVLGRLRERELMPDVRNQAAPDFGKKFARSMIAVDTWSRISGKPA
jgi:hypothetical protein